MTVLTLLPEEGENIILTAQDLLSLEDAGVAGGAFAMRPLNSEHLEHLRQSNSRKWPPILVTRCQAGYILIDGYHRKHVAEEIDCELRATCRAVQDEKDIIESAFRANLRHGLPANAESRGDYAYWVFLSFPAMEQKDIAARVGLSQSAVSKAIAKREEEAKRALLGDEVDPEEQIKKGCKKFTHTALRFLQEVEPLSDEDLARILLSSVKRSEDKVRLARIGRLLAGNPPKTQFLRHT